MFPYYRRVILCSAICVHWRSHLKHPPSGGGDSRPQAVSGGGTDVEEAVLLKVGDYPTQGAKL